MRRSLRLVKAAQTNCATGSPSTTTTSAARRPPSGSRPNATCCRLRVDLPVGGERLPFEPGFSLRPFRPGHDEQAWLEVNNRAFAGHPEQGHWELDTLLAPGGDPMVRPRRVLPLRGRGRPLAGSCWTKVHDGPRRRRSGEIYVISVDPDFQGRGLGRALDAWPGSTGWPARAPIGMLYVDAANTGAVELYRSLGFHESTTSTAATCSGSAERLRYVPVPTPTALPMP